MSIEVKGLREVQEKLRGLGPKVSKKYVQKSLRASAKPVLRDAKANAPVKLGLVRKSLRIVAGRSRKTVIQVRIVLGLKMYVGKSYYGAFVELGHFTGKRPAKLKGLKGPDAKERYAALSRSAGRKFVPGKHFMLRAAEAGNASAIHIFAVTLWGLVERDLRS